jgi:hypothetical protein
VLFFIGATYVDTQDVVDLGPGGSVAVTFADWTALQRGTTVAACSTALSTDESTANDRIARSFIVRVIDVGVDQVVAPVGLIDSGLVVTPQAKVTNYGTHNGNFRAWFRIGASYVDSTFGTLTPGESRTCSFTGWAADALGNFAVSCAAEQTGDVYPDNNLAQDSCIVQVIPADAGMMRIVAPRGLVDSGAVLAPQAMVRNCGSNVISFPVIFTIGSTYADAEQVADLGPLDSSLVTFDDWTAGPVGMVTTRCSTMLAGDSIPANDARSDSVEVIIRTTDAGVTSIIVPYDTVDSGTVFAPLAWVRNHGLNAISFPVRMRIGTGGGAYADTQQVADLAAGDSVAVRFGDYTVARRGATIAVCSTMVVGDQDPANDVVRKSIFRRVRDVGADSIVAPTGVVEPGTVVLPTATVRNFGNTTDSFPVIFRIGTFYADTLRTNDSSATFRPCTLSVEGTFSVVCSTAMVGDAIWTNDAVRDSVRVWSSAISGADLARGIPRTVTLSSTGPSPFAGRVAIEYGLPRSADMRLEVYDACGRLVQVVTAGVGQPGFHTAVWQCTDERGRAVAEGAYFVRLTADGATLTSKIVKME